MARMDWPVDVDPVCGCWLWQGRRDRDGYARTSPGFGLAYVSVYRAEVGAIPHGLVLDHVCRRRACVAPYHLEPVTKRENERRKQWGYRVRQRTCPNGHDLYSNGRRTEYGGRICAVCSGVKEETNA